MNTGESIGGYRLLQRLGTGGAATVWLASDEAGERVALKLLHPALAATEEARGRLLRESRTVNAVTGTGVAHIVDIEVDATQPFVVSEYIPGASLAELLTHGFIEPRGVAALALALADTITRVHDAKIVHRDIKPSNIICSARGPVLIDFGIAMGEDDEHFTSTGLVSGTAGYTAPELLRGQSPSTSSDWWAWHATLLTALTGRPPYGRGESRGVLMRVMEGQPDVRGLPDELATPLLRGLHADPGRRPSHEHTVDALCAATDWFSELPWESLNWGELLSPNRAPQIHVAAAPLPVDRTMLLGAETVSDGRGNAPDRAPASFPVSANEDFPSTRLLPGEAETLAWERDERGTQVLPPLASTSEEAWDEEEYEAWDEGESGSAEGEETEVWDAGATEHLPSYQPPFFRGSGRQENERTRYLPQKLPADTPLPHTAQNTPLPDGGWLHPPVSAGSPARGVPVPVAPAPSEPIGGVGYPSPGASLSGAAPAPVGFSALPLPYSPRYPQVSHIVGVALMALAAMLVPFGGAMGTGALLVGLVLVATVGSAVRWREQRRWRAGAKRGGDTPAMLAMVPILAIRSLLALIPGCALGGAMVASQWFLMLRGNWARWGISPDLPPLNTAAGTPEWTWPVDVATASSLLLHADRWLHYPVWVAVLWAMTWVLLLVCWLMPTSRSLREGVGVLTSVVLVPLWARILFALIAVLIVVGTGILIGVPWLI